MFNKVRNFDNPFQVMIDAIPTMAWCSLADGSVEFLNQRWHDYTGLPPEEAHGWGWKVAILHQDIASVMDNGQALLASGEAGYCRLAGGTIPFIRRYSTS